MLTLLKKIFVNKATPDYVSPAERFLYKLNRQFPKKSASQVSEIKKYDRVFYLRDNALKTFQEQVLWEDF